MRTRRTARSNKVSADLREVPENFHASEETAGQFSSFAAQPTLADASKEDVDKLLQRAGVRGAFSKDRSKRVRDEMNFDTRKRGKQKAIIEGESSLFCKGKVSRKSCGDWQNDQSKNSLVCGAIASTLADVRYGGSNGHEAFLPINKESLPSEMDNIMGTKVSNSTTNLNNRIESKQLHPCDLEVTGKDVPKEVHTMDDVPDWELGFGIPGDSAEVQNREERVGIAEINIEVDTATPTISEKQAGKPAARRASAKDKDFAELVHKAHLLCLIARGRIVDSACNDPLLQASLLSMVPPQINFCDTEKLFALGLEPLVKWFQATF